MDDVFCNTRVVLAKAGTQWCPSECARFPLSRERRFSTWQVAVRVLLAVALGSAISAAAAQSAYPTRTIQMIVPLAAASAVDNAARILAQRMSENMGQAIVIENQPGAAGLIGVP